MRVSMFSIIRQSHKERLMYFYHIEKTCYTGQTMAFFTQQLIQYTKCWRSRWRAHGDVIA